MKARKRSVVRAWGPVWFLAVFVTCVSGVAEAQNPVPVINQPLVPDSIAPIGQTFTLTVNGTGFVSGAVVNWKGHARTTTFVSKSKLTATILASDVTKAGTVQVTVTNPAPGGGSSNPAIFEIGPRRTSLAFSQSANYATGANTEAVITDDFNGDGYLDLAVVNNTGPLGGGGLTILLGYGAGIFYPLPVIPIANAYSLADGDFNHDGKLDLAVASWGGSSPGVSILLGNGDGTFTLKQVAHFAARSLAAGDVNGDGNLDLVVGGSEVAVFVGRGDGTFSLGYRLPGNEVWSVALGDFNHDGSLDMAYVGDTDMVFVQLNRGKGLFFDPVSYATGNGAVAVVAADFNRDGKLDLAVGNQTDGTASVLLGRADGTFENQEVFAAGSQPNSIAAGDFNSDGYLDLAAGDIGSGGTAVSVLTGNGDGTLNSPADFATMFAPDGIAAMDVNSDGKLDVVFAGLHSVSTMVQTKTGR